MTSLLRSAICSPEFGQKYSHPYLAPFSLANPETDSVNSRAFYSIYFFCLSFCSIMSSTENSSSGQPQQHLTNASTTTYYKEVVTLNEASCVFYSIVSVSATLCNGAVLLAIYKDPLRCFRGPRAFFMAVALLCGLVNGGLLAPLTAYGFKLNINLLPSWEKETNLQHGLEVSTVCLSTLSLTVLLIYSWHQAKITSSRRKLR